MFLSFWREKPLPEYSFQVLRMIFLQTVRIEFYLFDIFISHLIAEVFICIIYPISSRIRHKLFILNVSESLIRFWLKVFMIFVIFESVFAFDEEKVSLGEVDLICLFVRISCPMIRCFWCHKYLILIFILLA